MASTARKAPDDDLLARDVHQGMSLRQLCMRYNVTVDYMRRRLKALGATPGEAPVIPLVEDDRRIIITKRVTAAEFGGSAQVRISLPRVSMHVAYRENAHG